MPRFEDLLRAIRAIPDDLVVATMFLTRLPVAALAPVDSGFLARSMRAFPLVGVVVGAIGGAAFWAASSVGLPGVAAGLLAVLATVLATGALHEDGLADTADGLGGGRDRERALVIMRDSRSGAYGVLALAFSVGLRATALSQMTPLAATAALVAAHAAARALMPLLMRFGTPARADGLGASAGQPDGSAALWCVVLGIAVPILLLPWRTALAGIVLGALLAAGLAALARRRIGGYTGDVLGAVQQLGEIAMLLAAAA